MAHVDGGTRSELAPRRGGGRGCTSSARRRDRSVRLDKSDRTDATPLSRVDIPRSVCRPDHRIVDGYAHITGAAIPGVNILGQSIMAGPKSPKPPPASPAESIARQ